MGVRAFLGGEAGTDDYSFEERCVLFCSVTNVPLPLPIFDSLEAADDFLAWMPRDPRKYDAAQLRAFHDTWLEERLAPKGEPNG